MSAPAINLPMEPAAEEGGSAANPIVKKLNKIVNSGDATRGTLLKEVRGNQWMKLIDQLMIIASEAAVAPV